MSHTYPHTGIATCSSPTATAKYNTSHGNDNDPYEHFTLDFDSPVSYCAPFESEPTQISSYKSDDQLSDWNTAIQDLNYYYWRYFKMYGHTCKSLYDDVLPRSSNYLLTSANLGYAKKRVSNDNLARKLLRCYYAACGECKESCYMNDDINGTLFVANNIFDCYSGHTVTVTSNTPEGFLRYVDSLLLTVICFKEFMKICFMLAYFLSSEVQTSAIIKVFMNNPLMWIFLLNSKRLREEITKIKQRRERQTLRRVLDIFLEDVPSLGFSVWYVNKSRSFQPIILFTISGSLFMAIRNIYILFLNIKSDYRETKQDYNLQTGKQVVSIQMQNNNNNNNNNGNYGSPVVSASLSLSPSIKNNVLSLQDIDSGSINPDLSQQSQKEAISIMEQRMALYEAQVQQMAERVTLLEAFHGIDENNRRAQQNVKQSEHYL